MSSILKIKQAGQSIWLDYIRRDILENGDLKKMIDEDGLSGMTSNPAIFEKAISNSNFYDEDIKRLASEGKSPEEIYEAIAIADVQAAADIFFPVYEKTHGWDGYVSLEVNPHLALNTDGTIEEAHKLWKLVNRPNVYIKVPGTEPGIPAIERLISEGVNINITLLFGLKRYMAVVEAYMRGLENLVISGKNLDTISSVASFFVSRIDTMIDPKIQKFIGLNGEKAHFGTELYGEIGTANAILAFEIFKEVFDSERFKKIKLQGAAVQRLLWASTGTKNPDFSDVKYIDALLIPGTINTVPPETFEAYKDHGDITKKQIPDLIKAKTKLSLLPEMGININEITDELEKEGIKKFNEPYDKMIQALFLKV